MWMMRKDHPPDPSGTGHPIRSSVMDISKDIPATGSPSATTTGGTLPGNALVAFGFIRSVKDGDLIAASGRIEASIGASYPSSEPSLAELTSARDAFVAAVQANDGGVKAIALRDQARRPLERVLRDLATYVQHASRGDHIKVLASGFAIRRTSGHAARLGPEPLQAPVGLRLRRGNASGQIFVRCKAVRSARLYQWRYATAQAPTSWMFAETSSSSASVIEGLVAGTQYRLQVRAYGRRGASDWSESVTLFAS
jgi:hypothetical protein